MRKFWSGVCLCLVLGGAALSGCDEASEAPQEDALSQGQIRFGDSFPGALVGDLPDPIEDPAATEADLAELISNNTDFAFDAYVLAADGAEGNTFFSPHSISVAFGMALPVANDSEPLIRNLHLLQDPGVLHPSMNLLQREFARHAEAVSESGEPFILNMPNGVWVDEALADGFGANDELLTLYGGHYNAPIAALPFRDAPEESEDRINAWVSDQTEGLIEELMQGNVKPTSLYVLVNAIYFKASWQTPFNEFATRPAPFMTPSGEVEAETMSSNGFGSFADNDEYRAVTIPYISDGMQMLVVMPKGDFAQFEAAWSPAKANEVLSSLQGGALQLRLPKFKIKQRVDLTDLLEDPFSSAIHEANIEVDEKGTVASAATAVEIGGNNDPEYMDASIDRAFIFMIRDVKTSAILFMGRVVDPTL